MYAIIEAGGRQWKVEPGTTLEINRVTTAPGAELTVERVLFAHDGQQPHIGRPYVQGARVVFEVLDHRLGPKTISYHFRRRENWRKTVGHRQPLSRLVVKTILCGGKTASHDAAKAPARAKAAGAAAPSAPAAAKKTSAVKTKLKTLSSAAKPAAPRKTTKA